MMLGAHLFGVLSVIPDHLRAFIRNMLGDGGEKVRGLEDLEDGSGGELGTRLRCGGCPAERWWVKLPREGCFFLER